MRVALDRADLAHTLAVVTKTIEARNTIPILGNVALAVADGRLTVTGTDLDIEATTSLPVLDSADGAITVPGKLLADIAKKATGDVLLELVTAANKTQHLSVKSGRSRYKLETLPIEDFPSFTVGQYDTSLELDLAALVAPCAHAMSSEETRYYLCGVYLHAVDGRLVAVGTDGHRLVRSFGADAGEANLEYGVILPRKLIGLLPKGVVKVDLSKSKIRITVGDTVLTSKLIDGTYPDYERIIPRDYNHHVTVDRDAMLRAVERVSVVADEKGRAIKLAFAADELTLSVADKASEQIDVTGDIEGGGMEIGFNGGYLADALRVFDAGPVVFKLGDAGSPALLDGGGLDGGITLMPMRY